MPFWLKAKLTQQLSHETSYLYWYEWSSTSAVLVFLLLASLTCFLLRPAMAAEPSAGELRGMDTIEKVLNWVPINDLALRAAWLRDLGLNEGDPVRSLADIEKEDIERVRDALRIAETGLNPAARGRVVKSWRVARLAAGADKTREETDRD